MNKLLYKGSEWNLDLIHKMWSTIDKLASSQFDYYEPQIEIITSEHMLDCYSSVAMPIMYPHWSFGKTFVQNERQYQKGLQGLAYEVVINTNPCIAYLMENNTATLQALVLSHASVGHSHFFKNNYLFKGWTDAESIIDYLKFAKSYVKKCEERYGEKEVEYLLDACHSLQNHGVDKYKKPSKLSKELQKDRQLKRQQYLEKEFDDLWRTVPVTEKLAEKEESMEPEENILYFIEKNSPILEEWQREVVRIVRKVAQYFYPQKQTQLMNEGFACVKGDTEYLSPTGWKRIDKYDGGLVAQYNEDGTIEYVEPSNYIVQPSKELIEFEAEGFNQCVTPDHRMVYRSSRGHINEILAADLTLSTSRKFIPSGILETNSIVDLTEAELRVMVAICADGHFNPNTCTTHCQMAFVRQEKINRFKKLLNQADISYSIQEQSQGRTCFSFYAPERNKCLSKYWEASYIQLKVILDEAKYWDGSVKGHRIVYFNTNKEDMKFLQYAGSVTGHKTSFREQKTSEGRSPLYVVELLRTNSVTLSGGTKTKLPGKHTVYCFSVPSGMFVTRRKNKVSVTGNCWTHHRLMTQLHDQGYIDDGSYLEFLQSHSNVVAQRDWDSKYYTGINVYALGFAMMKDIERICLEPDEEDKEWFPSICNTDPLETIKDIVANYRDESFIQQFLSPKIIRKFKLFSLHVSEGKPYLEVNATQEDYEHIRNALAERYDLSRSIPHVEVTNVDWNKDRWLYLTHTTKNNQRLNYGDMKRTVTYVHELWGFPVKMEYVDLEGRLLDSVSSR